MLTYLAALIGTSEPALRLLVTLLIAYPLGLFHRKYLFGTSPNLQHLYFILTSLTLGYFNYGFDIVHSLVCIIIMYAIMTLAPKRLSPSLTFVACMSYLLFSYYTTCTKDYDIKWSLPHCVLVLRLIAIAFDLCDGKKDPEKLSKDQQKTAMASHPSFLEVAGCCYYIGGFMVGPQFSMKRYLSFVQNKFPQKALNGTPSCLYAAAVNLLQGIGVLVLYQVGSMLIPERYLLTESFNSLCLINKLLIMGLWGKICLYKYIACWLIAEGSCILTGMTYNGEDDEGQTLWDGCNNVNLSKYETTSTFDGIIRAFNINTNLWVSQYVFKRLKFLGNKYLSQLLSLLFLAVWHGIHSGYYICFFNEFIVMKFEREVSNLISKNEALYTFLNTGKMRIISFILKKLFVTVFFGYSIVPFVLLSNVRWLQVYSSVYFIGHILFVGWLIVFFLYSLISKNFFSAPKKVKSEN